MSRLTSALLALAVAAGPSAVCGDLVTTLTGMDSPGKAELLLATTCYQDTVTAAGHHQTVRLCPPVASAV